MCDADQSLESLQAYVLVSQDQRLVKVYQRAGQSWTAVCYRDGESFALPDLAQPIVVADVYDRILDTSGRSALGD